MVSSRICLAAVRVALLAAGLMLLPGCWVKANQPGSNSQPMTKVQDASTGQKSQPDLVVVPPSPGPTQPIFSEVIDPCASKLQDIEGALLSYYIAKRTFPARLEEAAPFVDPGKKADFLCPLCNKPYVYLPPGGTAAAGQVLAFAPVPDKDGKYRVIKMRPAAGNVMGSLPDVVTMSPDEMKPYLSRVPQ